MEMQFTWKPLVEFLLRRYAVAWIEAAVKLLDIMDCAMARKVGDGTNE
jgi:hypothetical protein